MFLVRSLWFLKCEAGTTGEAIAKMILTQLEEWQLEPQLLWGQAYDGAGAMAGLTKGVAGYVQSTQKPHTRIVLHTG